MLRPAADAPAPDRVPAAAAGHHVGQTDYALIRRAILYLSEGWATHPTLDDLAGHLGLSPAHCQKLFKRWCGLSPKEFVAAMALDRARQMLAGSASVLETAHEVGLSGGSRLHDLFITHEAMTPGEYKRRGAGVAISYAFCDSPFGDALVMATQRGICGIAFVDEDKGQTQADAFADMTGRWPQAIFTRAPATIAPLAARVFEPVRWHAEKPLRLVLIGSTFETRVWEALMKIPMGRAVSYADIARHLGQPTAARAVGAAVGRNPISFAVPCHRVLRGDGQLAGYHWGLTRKRALIGWETAWLARQST
jgi:AraC family transcriptional regulator of adaptative response/methylated-DNA-[protein]-cysteine methyltransferase